MGDSYDDLEAAQCRDCIKLREQVDELMKDKADAWELIEEFRHENSEQRCQLAAAQATIERLREALEAVETTCSYNGPEDEIGEHSCCHELSYLPHSPDCWTHLRTKALALPNDTTALDARLKEEREKCAMLAQVAGAKHVTDTIRRMSK